MKNTSFQLKRTKSHSIQGSLRSKASNTEKDLRDQVTVPEQLRLHHKSNRCALSLATQTIASRKPEERSEKDGCTSSSYHNSKAQKSRTQRDAKQESKLNHGSDWQMDCARTSHRLGLGLLRVRSYSIVGVSAQPRQDCAPPRRPPFRCC